VKKHARVFDEIQWREGGRGRTGEEEACTPVQSTKEANIKRRARVLKHRSSTY
jgi:hypothetical protein